MSGKHLFGQVTVSLICATMLSAACAAEELSLSQAIDIALKHNPSVAAENLSAQAAAHAARGAKALPNPDISVAPTVAGESGSDAAAFISQPLEMNGTRRVRGQIASHQANAAALDAAAVRNGTVRDVKQAYWDVAYAQELVELNEENVEYLSTLRSAVQRQLDVGTVPGSQLIKTDVELAGARQELAKAKLELDSAKAALATLMGRPHERDFTVAAPPVPAAQDSDLALAGNADAPRRPEVFAAAAQLEAARGRTHAAKLARIPDLAVQARRSSLGSDAVSGVAVVVSLPFLDWGSAKAERETAEAAARSQEMKLEAVSNQAKLDAEEAVLRLHASSSIVAEYQGGILEKSEQLAQMARTGYERGATSYLEVLEAQRTLRSTRAAYYSALTEHAKAIAQFEWATGNATLEVER